MAENLRCYFSNRYHNSLSPLKALESKFLQMDFVRGIWRHFHFGGQGFRLRLPRYSLHHSKVRKSYESGYLVDF